LQSLVDIVSAQRGDGDSGQPDSWHESWNEACDKQRLGQKQTLSWMGEYNELMNCEVKDELVSSIKAEVKKKISPAAGSFLASQPIWMNEICSDLPCQGLGCWDVVAQRFGFSLSAVFIACSQRSLSVPKPTKQNGGQVETMVLSETFCL
jgi:hypothetical protein